MHVSGDGRARYFSYSFVFILIFENVITLSLGSIDFAANNTLESYQTFG